LKVPAVRDTLTAEALRCAASSLPQVAKLEKKTGSDRDADGEKRQSDPCDEMDFVHDVHTPMIEPIERWTNCTARQCTTITVCDRTVMRT
jgi:hypothetical protein